MVRTVLIGFTLLSFACFSHAQETNKRPPNIVFILADDLGWFDLGCYGRKDQPTPSLDKLAKQGMRFTNAYAAQSLCSPTRAAIMTGKSPARLHLTTFLPGRADTPTQMLNSPLINQELPKSAITLASRLKSLRYVSGLIGKWHLGGKGSLPTDHGFDVYYPGKAVTTPSATEGGKGEYDLTAKAEAFIEENKDRPFYLALCHNNPHVALIAKQELIEKHKKAFNPTYAAMIETLDDCVGKILAKLDALGLAENTIVVFTSDNGGLHVLESPLTPATYHPLFRAGKGFIYEGGVRISLIVRWPGKVPADKASDTPVISTDWVPTFLELTGVKSSDAFDGVSLAGLLTRDTPLSPRALHWHFPHYSNQGGRPAGAIREGNWKLIEHYENGACELYDLAKDVGENTDLSMKEPGRVADLRGKLEKWRRDVGAQSMTPNPKYSGKRWQPLYHDVDSTRFKFFDTAEQMAEAEKAWRTGMNNAVPNKKKGAVVEGGAGVVILHPANAKIHGQKLRYEPQPNKDTLGFWVAKDDWAEWNFEFPNPGTFDLEILQACGKGSGGAELEIAVAGQTFTHKVIETGHFQNFVPRIVGTVRIASAGPATLSVRAKTKPGPAVMDLRRVTLKSVE